jgi:hypothetical protein
MAVAPMEPTPGSSNRHSAAQGAGASGSGVVTGRGLEFARVSGGGSRGVGQGWDAGWVGVDQFQTYAALGGVHIRFLGDG